MAVSAGLVVWLFHKINIHQVEQIIHRGVDYRFIAAMMALTVLSHIIRGLRWGMQLRAAGIPRIPAMAESVSIFGAYALSLYGISDTDGAAFSIIFWSFQAMILIASGIFSAFYIIYDKRRLRSGVKI